MTIRRSSGVRSFSEVRRVLIVDDNHDSAELLALLIGREGHETRVAYHPNEAIPLAARFCPDIAFLDIGLPEMDGFELLRILSQAPELTCCKFVAVTGYERLPEPEGAREFDAHLVKPIDLETVLRLVRELASPNLVALKPISA